MKIPCYISHRGANTHAIENTIDAFEIAYAKGMRAIELDVQISCDGVLYLFHDDRIGRFCDQDSVFHHLNSAQIDALILSYQGHQGKVMKLVDYLEWLTQHRDVVTNLELKIADTMNAQNKEQYLEQLTAMLYRYRELASQWLVSSFDHALLKKFVQSNPHITIAYLVEFKDYRTDLNNFLEHSYQDYLQLNSSALAINANILNEGRIAELKKYCGSVLVYTLGRAEHSQIQQLLTDGADAVFIDEVNDCKSNILPRGKIGFLATGNEITDGDIINTNSIYMAQELNSLGYEIGQHLACNDSYYDIYHSLDFLFKHHQVVITIGGLGPTIDDLTSETIARYANKPWQFNEASWQRIVERLSPRYKAIPESNRKQAHFADGAEIFANANGTADGCYVSIGDKHLFMLPGPPNELRPMFQHQLLPKLKTILESTNTITHYYQVMGIGESELATYMKPIVDAYDLDIGYRIAYPYIEIKISQAQNNDSVLSEFVERLSPYLIAQGRKTASELLREALVDRHLAIQLQGDCMKGYLLYQFSKMQKSIQSNQKIKLKTMGMDAFWKGEAVSHDLIHYQICYGDNLQVDQNAQMRVYGEKTADYVFEFICHQLLTWINKELK